MEELLNWANDRLSDEKFFPTAPGVPFPEDFESGIKMMFRRFFRVYAAEPPPGFASTYVSGMLRMELRACLKACTSMRYRFGTRLRR